MPMKTSILYFTVILLLCTPLHAEELTTDAAAADIELFEFIADGETHDGQWIEASNFEEQSIKGNG